MKKNAITLIAFLLALQSFGQVEQNAKQLQVRQEDMIGEALVKLAMMNPQIASLENLSRQFDYVYRRNKTGWLDNIVLSGNLNEFSIKEGGASIDPLRQSTQYPRYNLGVRLPLGLFANASKESTAALYKFRSSLNDVKSLQLEVRRRVLSLYEDYKMYKESKVLQQEIIQDVKFLFAATEEKFGNGEVSLELFTNASKAYNAEKSKMITINHSLRTTEIQLEELIGMRLIDALHQIDVQK